MIIVQERKKCKQERDGYMSERYSSVMQLGRHSDTMLLRDLNSGYLVVRRIAGAKQAEIYQMLKDIHEPHIPAVYSITPVESGQYEIMEEYIQGRTLEEILQEEDHIDESRTAWYITQLCDVLEKIHKAGLIHRDIKPGNIIITPNDQLYLIDFEIARTRKEEKDSDTEILGTQGYAAPEQFGFHQTGPQADIYSTGILLNEMLTGKMPNESLPKGFMSHVVRQCIQMDTAKRYKNAKVLKRVLRPFLPKNHPKAPKILRHIPGFRSFTTWKMVVACIFYAFIPLSIYILMPEFQKLDLQGCIFLIAAIIIYGTLFLFIFDSFHIRSHILWLEKSRGKGFVYLMKCIILFYGFLILVMVIEVWIETIIC